MNVKEILEGMAARAFSASFLDGVCELYDARDNGSTEADYETGMAQLAGILNDDQKADLQEMEQAYKARRNCASVYGFKCGLYGAFRQHFGQHTAQDGGFQDLVCNDLLMQPKMQRHHENYANIERCNSLDATISETLSEADQEHLVSISCAWQQRIYNAAMDGFYCGYRAAYDLMEVIHPLVKAENMDKILTMEYHLGYIKPYSEVERLQDQAA